MKKFLVVLLSIIYSIITIVFVLFSFLNLKIYIERKIITNEILSVENIINNENIDVEKYKNNFKKDMATGNNLIIEHAIENYLLDILINKDKLIKYEKYLNNTEVTSIEDLTIVENYKDELDSLKNNIDSLNKDNYISALTQKESVKNEYNNMLLDRFGYDELKIKYENICASMDRVIAIVSFLKSNETFYKIENNEIVFLKRNSYNLYKPIVDDINDDYIIKVLNYKLIEDTEGPIIEASGINILVGTRYNFNSNVKCYDEVDDSVECKIEGSYDVNTVGAYSMKVSATDLSGNTSSKDVVIKVNEPEKPTGQYYIEIIRNYSTVVVYGLDDNGEYTKIVKVMPASVGAGGNTPLGTFKTTRGSAWGGLIGGVYGQYYTRIVGSILFHSVPYYSMDKSTLWWQEYNNLGTARSLGCIRLTVEDSKWIYDNCPTGTTVKVLDGELPPGVEKPSAPKIDPNSPNRGWDPTDPDPNNPWKQ